jgi:branched-chain amino acid transport system permease protein
MTANVATPTVHKRRGWRLRATRPTVWLILLITAAFVVLPWWTDDVSMRESLLLAAVYITLASNLNLMIGYAGYVNFGNIVFFGLGGYFGIYFADTWHWPLVFAALAGGLCVSAFAMLFGFGILRLRGAFFALATIGVNEAVRAFVVNFEPWGGATGIYLALDDYTQLGGPMQALWTIYFLIVAVMGLSLLLSYAIKGSKFGLGLRAIGQNEDAAAVLGVNTRRYKAFAYSVSAFLPAVAGGLYFFKSGIIEPASAFNLTQSIEAIVMVMLGGHGTVIGPAIGAFLYEELRSGLLTSDTFSHFQLVVAGALLLVIILFVPGGLMGWLHQRFPRSREVLE